MNEHFLQLYNEELADLRQKAARFADAFPKVAGRLRLSADIADDPQTERLLQSFAYSTARIRQKLDDEFPQLTNELLEILYPHCLATVPSMTMVKFLPDPKQDGFQIIPRQTELISEPIDGDICRFRTTQDVQVAPIEIAGVELSGQPLTAPHPPFTGAAGCLHISLKMLDQNASFNDINLKKLRFFLAAGWNEASQIFELLANNILGIALAKHPFDTSPVFLDKSKFMQAGFDGEESILPYPVTSFVGYRLLAEFFTLPQKFLFFDIADIHGQFSDQLHIFIYLKASNRQLEKSIKTSHIELNVSPAINIFDQNCEPLKIDGTRTEYRLVPDIRRHHTREVLTVKKVRLRDRNGQEYNCQPFFKQSQCAKNANIFWQLKRQINVDDALNDAELSFVDWQHKAYDMPDMIASVDALCSNGNLPSKLPFGGGHPRLNTAGSFSIAGIKTLIPPTPSIRRSEPSEREWCLISHLLLNHASLADQNGAALKAILQLYILGDMPEQRRLVDAISRVEAKNSTAYLKGGAVLAGTDIMIEFDPNSADKASVYLFGTILERFFGLYTSINSYTRLTIKIAGVAQILATWPPRAAERPLI